MSNSVTSAMRQKIRQWKDRLTDVSKSNRLLHFNKEQLSTVEIITKASSIYASLLEEDYSPIPIKNWEIEQEGDQLAKFLKKLRQDSNSLLKEKGVNSLFIALGTLTWMATEKSTEFISPVLLIPVELRKTRGKQEYEIHRFDESFSFNPLLARKLSTDFGIELPENEEIPDLSYADLLNKFDEHVNNNYSWNLDRETAYISLFQDSKAAMLQDMDFLEADEDLFTKHPILSRLADEKIIYNSNLGSEKLDPKNLDDLNPNSVFQILEADSSQQIVIEAAKKGFSFVVQGPPGTGKSQSIVNIVAELIGQRKKVLLIAQKETALDVVFDNLRRCGLEDACLKLHHTGRKDKKAPFSNLKETDTRLLQLKELSLVEDTFFEKLSRRRTSLNEHRLCLHKKHDALNKSAFDLYGELLKRTKVQTLEFTLPNIKEWSNLRILDAQDLLKQKLVKFVDFFTGQQTTIWSESRSKSWSYEKQEVTRQKINSLIAGIQVLKKTVVRLDEMLEIQCPDNLANIRNIQLAINHVVNVPLVPEINVPLVPEGWLLETDIHSLQTVLSDLKGQVECIEKFRAYLSAKYRPEFFDLNFLYLKKCYQRKFKKWMILQCIYWRLVTKRKASIQLLNLRQVKSQASDQELLEDINQAIDLQFFYSQLQDPNHHARLTFGSLFREESPNWDGIDQALNWLERLSPLLPKQSIAKVLASRDDSRELRTLSENLEIALNEIQTSLNVVLEHFPEEVIATAGSSLEQTSLDDLLSFVTTAQRELDMFPNWLEYQEIIEKLNAIGCKSFLSKVLESDLQPEYWFPVLEKGIYHKWIEYIHSNNPDLRNFKSDLHDDTIKEFADIDPEQFKIARHRLQQRHSEQWREFSGEASVQSQLQSLKKELSKTKPQQIRQFIKSAPDLVTTLKPCWLMSPLAVSHYLDPEVIRFDTVIFDEASQILTEEAVPSIMRATQVIIFGDNKQLPPTSFFKSASSNEDEDEEEIYDSLLDECWTFMKNFTLKWHYRSQDESLIAFSNQKFYDSQMISFPNSAKDSNRGVDFHYVSEGVYDRAGRRDNIVEAECLAQLTLEHVKNGEQSLGIITFSKAQEDAIREQLDKLSKNNSKLEEFCQENSDKFFLKSLERVQGDERDVIFLSFGYGFNNNNQDKLVYNFGPLTKKVGINRLNVAITRAKYKLLLVASIRAEDLEPEDKTAALGMLKEFFTYAASRGQNLAKKLDNDASRLNLPFEDDVCQALCQLGYTVKRRVGYSAYPIDLAVIDDRQADEEKFLLGIECDGATYNSLPTVRDRDRLRQQVLQKLGWHIYRIWSREWFGDREGQLNKLMEQLECLREQ